MDKKQVIMLFVEGRAFWCEDCGCTLFLIAETDPFIYACVNCGERYKDGTTLAEHVPFEVP